LARHRVSDPPATGSRIKTFACGLQAAAIISCLRHCQQQLACLYYPQAELSQGRRESTLAGADRSRDDDDAFEYLDVRARHSPLGVDKTQ
jgi:hypothetical protein